ncbi:MAG: uroporphyrinogen-III C-methyltransferase [Rhodobacteraceae bacterium]|nr:uroporphyrinogen-III C-methyltransferase [Paracoccaceae bacterium]
MQHFPVYIAVAGRRVAVSGGGAAAVAKVRLLLKTDARIAVFAADAAPEILAWADEARIDLVTRTIQAGDAAGAALVYAANEDAVEDARIAAIARAEGALVNIVDDLDGSDFLTPAIVDRNPVTVAIGTEGAAPVLARRIKADLEAVLPQGLGVLARIGKAFRSSAEALPQGSRRRDFWADYYFEDGPRALAEAGEAGIGDSLANLLARHLAEAPRPGRVDFVGAGPGDPDLLTLKARRALDRADVVIHDRLVAPEILELARREATIVLTGKEGFGPSVAQAEINALIVDHAGRGAHVVRLKSGDPTVFGRLDEEIEAVEAAGIAWSIVPGITAASAAVASAGQSLTRRGRNSELRLLTGHDVKGFADHDWAALARPGAVAAIYMAKRGARFLQGRLLMHGALPQTPVTVVENASRPDEQILGAHLGTLSDDIARAGLSGPAVLLYGLAPRSAAAALDTLSQKEFAL